MTFTIGLYTALNQTQGAHYLPLLATPYFTARQVVTKYVQQSFSTSDAPMCRNVSRQVGENMLTTVPDLTYVTNEHKSSRRIKTDSKNKQKNNPHTTYVNITYYCNTQKQTKKICINNVTIKQKKPQIVLLTQQ